jgi:hypothetical protein
MERVARDKRASLFGLFIGDEEKRFNGIDTRMKNRFDLFQSAYMSVSPSKDHLNELVPILQNFFFVTNGGTK